MLAPKLVSTTFLALPHLEQARWRHAGRNESACRRLALINATLLLGDDVVVVEVVVVAHHHHEGPELHHHCPISRRGVHRTAGDTDASMTVLDMGVVLITLGPCGGRCGV